MGVHKNGEQAFYWYEKAASQGNASAQSNVAVLYYHGFGVPKDYEKAVYWDKKSANQGFSEAQFNLGNMYADGEGGLPKDYEQAFYWYEKAALQDNPRAQYMLGMMYLKGKGVPRSLVLAYSWFSQGQSSHYLDSMNQTDYLQSIMASEELIEAQLHSFEIVKKIEAKTSSKVKKKASEDEIDIFKDLDNFFEKNNESSENKNSFWKFFH